jgi:hypothetical protein
MPTSPTPDQPCHQAASPESAASARAEPTREGRRWTWRTSAVVGVLAITMSLGTGLVLSADASHAPAGSGQPSRINVGPPPVRLSNGWADLVVRPFTSCWSDDDSGMCYDGRPPHPAPSLGETTGPVTLAFPRNRWHFSVSVVDSNGHRSDIRLVRISAQQWRLVVKPLAADHYRASVFGRGPQGDVAATFAFTVR